MDYYDNNHIDILISRYLAGDATSPEIEELFNWIQSDDDNRKYFLRQQDIWSVLNPAVDISDINTADAERKILKGTGIIPRRRSVFRKLFGFWSRIAAVILLPLLAVVAYLLIDRPQRAALDNVTITTAFGSLSSTDLPDGTTVWLNANSSLTYSPAMDGNERNVFLQGEAYFKVKADARHPFNVHTPYMTVTATGTEFNVNAYDSVASVTLVNGHVNVGIKNRSLALKPGEHLSMTDGRPVICKLTDTEKYCCWKKGMLIFEDESLVSICNRLQQMYDVEFDIAPELRNRTFRMILNGENINEVTRFFEMSAPVICESLTPKEGNDTTNLKQRYRIIPL